MPAYTFNVLGLDSKAEQLLPKQLATIQKLLAQPWELTAQEHPNLLLTTDTTLLPSEFTGIYKVLRAENHHLGGHNTALELPLRTLSLLSILNEAAQSLTTAPAPTSTAPTPAAAVSQPEPVKTERAAHVSTRTAAKAEPVTAVTAKAEPTAAASATKAVKEPKENKESAPGLNSVIKNVADRTDADLPVAKAENKPKFSIKDYSAEVLSETAAGRLKARVKPETSDAKAVAQTEAPKAESRSKATPSAEKSAEADKNTKPAPAKKRESNAKKTTSANNAAKSTSEDPTVNVDSASRIAKSNSTYWESAAQRLLQLTNEGTFAYKSKQYNYWLAFHDDSKTYFTNAKNFDTLVSTVIADANDTWSYIDNAEISSKAGAQQSVFQINAKTLIWSIALHEERYAMERWNKEDAIYRIARWPRLESWESRPEFFKLCALFSTKDASIVTAAKLSRLSAEEVTCFLHACDQVEIPIRTRVMSAEELEATRAAARAKLAAEQEAKANPVTNSTVRPAEAESSQSILNALKTKLGI